jgi:AcrR family transcriptional regulator
MDVTRPRGRPRETTLDRRILEATLDVIAEVGYERMSMNDIATAAHTTRATIYLRYPSKAALTAQAIVYARRAITLPALTGDLRQDLIEQLHHFQGSMAAPYSLPLVGAVLAGEHTVPELVTVFREQVAASRRNMLRSILQEAQSRNELASGVDIDLVVAQLVGSYYAFSIAGVPVPSDWPQRVVDQVLTGILRDAPQHPEG